MAEHRWSLLCRHAVVDKYSNLLSILDVMDETGAEEPPKEVQPEDIGVGVNAQLVSLWYRSNLDNPETFWQRVTITMPDGKEHPTDAIIEGNLEKHPRTRLIVGIKAIPFGGYGTYSFNIHYSKSRKQIGKMVARVPLELKATTAEALASTEAE